MHKSAALPSILLFLASACGERPVPTGQPPLRPGMDSALARVLPSPPASLPPSPVAERFAAHLAARPLVTYAELEKGLRLASDQRLSFDPTKVRHYPAIEKRLML